jgi:hypothetical protein
VSRLKTLRVARRAITCADFTHNNALVLGASADNNIYVMSYAQDRVAVLFFHSHARPMHHHCADHCVPLAVTIPEQPAWAQGPRSRRSIHIRLAPDRLRFERSMPQDLGRGEGHLCANNHVRLQGDGRGRARSRSSRFGPLRQDCSNLRHAHRCFGRERPTARGQLDLRRPESRSSPRHLPRPLLSCARDTHGRH